MKSGVPPACLAMTDALTVGAVQSAAAVKLLGPLDVVLLNAANVPPMAPAMMLRANRSAAAGTSLGLAIVGLSRSGAPDPGQCPEPQEDGGKDQQDQPAPG